MSRMAELDHMLSELRQKARSALHYASEAKLKAQVAAVHAGLVSEQVEEILDSLQSWRGEELDTDPGG